MEVHAFGDEHKPTIAQAATSQAAKNAHSNDINNAPLVRAEKQDKQTQPETSSVLNNNREVPANKAGKQVVSAAGGGGGLVGATTAGGDKKMNINSDEKVKTETLQPDLDMTELLGSVTIHNCPGTRTSARVIQKMKQDQIRPLTPPLNERDHKKEEKNVQKTPSQVRANKSTWTNLERNHFFDALNEFGKDFDAIGNFINSKLKRKSATDVSFKSKDQVRQHYYQTYHKICKYIKFSEEIKKPAQELYALINYGEMRRKLQFVTDKNFMKLKNLVYHGHITVRCKGKNIRIKTPSCKALRRLNQLDDSLEDIRLPSKIEVIVSPANMESFGRVQTIAQNPRARTTVPLHKKLVNFIKTFQYKWRSSEMKLAEEAARLFPNAHTAAATIAAAAATTELNGLLIDNTEKQSTATTAAGAAGVSAVACQDAEMCFLPKPGVAIHRPLLSITEYLSSVNICLTAYEDRMGVKIRSDTLSQERTNNKRQRTDSGSEKRSPDTKKQKQVGTVKCVDAAIGCAEPVVSIKEETLKEEHLKSESSGDELNDEMHELLSDSDTLIKDEASIATDVTSSSGGPSSSSSGMAGITPTSTTAHTPIQSTAATPAIQPARAKRNNANNAKSTARSTLTFKPLLSDEVSRRIRQGWTVSSAADITIGDLYVVLGQDSRLELEYYWTDGLTATQASASSEAADTTTGGGLFTQKQNGMPYNPTECDDPLLLKTLSSSAVCNKLKHLLLIANLSERIRKRQQCSCGHTCERGVKTRLERDLAAKTFISTKSFNSNSCAEGSNLFRQPIVPIRRPIYNMDPVKQLTTLTRPKLSRQVLVQRLLLPGGSNHSYDLLDVKNLQNHFGDTRRNSNEACNTNTCNNEVHAAQGAETEGSTDSDTTDAFGGTSSENSRLIHTFNYDSNSSNSNSSAARTTSDTSTSSHLPHEHTINQTSNDVYTEHRHSEFSLPSSLPDSAFDECSNTSLFNGIMTPMHLLRDSTSNSRWLEENLNDFSLTSLLGHLDEINANRDILDPSSNLSVISESSVDFMHKFQEITALMQSQDKD